MRHTTRPNRTFPAAQLLSLTIIASLPLGGCDSVDDAEHWESRSAAAFESNDSETESSDEYSPSASSGFDALLVIDGDDLELSWEEQDNATYEVWWSEVPDFEAEDPVATLLGTTDDAVFLAQGAGTDFLDHHFLVRALTPSGTVAESIMVGKLVLQLETEQDRAPTTIPWHSTELANATLLHSEDGGVTIAHTTRSGTETRSPCQKDSDCALYYGCSSRGTCELDLCAIPKANQHCNEKLY